MTLLVPGLAEEEHNHESSTRLVPAGLIKMFPSFPPPGESSPGQKNTSNDLSRLFRFFSLPLAEKALFLFPHDLLDFHLPAFSQGTLAL